MTQPYLALITPIGGGGGNEPPGIWGGGNVPMPSPPIYMPPPQPPGIWGPGSPIIGNLPSPGGRPPHIWGGRPSYPDQSLPWAPGRPSQGLPGNQPYPDQGLPGGQPYPGQGLPGNQPYPDQGLPGGGGGGNYPSTGPGFPTAPIVIPPQEPPPTVPENKTLIMVYVPGSGYQWVVIDTPPGLNTKPSEPAEPK